MSDESTPMCGHLALPKFRRQAKELTPCVAEPEHKGNHIYALKVTNALQVFEEVKRTELKPIIMMDLKPGTQLSDEECAAVYQYMEAVKHAKM